MRNEDAVTADLRWFFHRSEAECEAPATLGALAILGDLADAPDRFFDVAPITRSRRIRNRLLSLDPPHADVISWMFEQRDWHPRVVSHFSYPGVAIRTFAAQWMLAIDGVKRRRITTDGPRKFDGLAGTGKRWPGLRPIGYRLRKGQWTPPEGHYEAVAPPRTGHDEPLPTGDFHRGRRPSANEGEPQAIQALLAGLDDNRKIKAVQAETSRRVGDALRAYEAAS